MNDYARVHFHGLSHIIRMPEGHHAKEIIPFSLDSVFFLLDHDLSTVKLLTKRIYKDRVFNGPVGVCSRWWLNIHEFCTGHTSCATVYHELCVFHQKYSFNKK